MTQVHQLHLGHVRLPDSHPRAPELTFQIYGYAIEHPSTTTAGRASSGPPDGVIVVDTGPRTGHPIIDDLYATTHRVGRAG